MNKLSFIDPRGKWEDRKIKLAKGITLSDLKNLDIIFYNNTKLNWNNYDKIFPTIKNYFKKQGAEKFIDYEETVRGKSTEDLYKHAINLNNKLKPDVAFIGVADMGVTPATTILTIAFEELNVPSILLTVSPGAELAEGVAFYRAGQLRICQLDIFYSSSKKEVIEEVESKIDYIFKLLIKSEEKTEGRFKLNFDLDKDRSKGNEYLKVNIKNKGSIIGSYMEDVMDICESLRIGDGLPIIPPTEERYNKMMEYCPYEPDKVLASKIGPTGKDLTVKDILISAIIAGCKPKYVPVLITAVKALSNKNYNFLQSVTTSHPGGNLILVSGPIAKEVGIHGGQGCLGPGFRANATIGRAINLMIINVCRSVPAACDLGCLGSQAEYSFCFREDPTLSPWLTINEERFDKETTTVSVLKAEPPHDIIDFISNNAGDLLDTIIDSCTTLAANNAYFPGSLVFVLTPDHVKIISRDGFSKSELQDYIHQRAHHPAPMVRNRGVIPVRPKGFNEKHPIPVTRSAEDVIIVVAGGKGGHSAVLCPWALHSEFIVEPMVLPNGKNAKSINEFK